MDTTRFDRLGCSGHEDATTATLDSLAQAGVRFASTITATPVTGPAITTILSGVLPPVHGVRDNRRFVINPELTLLAQVFAAAGYRTGAVVGAVPLLARFGYDRGFEYYDDRFSEDPYEIHHPDFRGQVSDLRQSERRATAVTDRALAWLTRAGNGKPIFLLAHYFDPHGPYDPPPQYAARHPVDPYDGEIAYLDAEIGRLLAGIRERLGQGHEVRVVAVGDHGEGLFDHNEMGHGFFVYDTTVKVPLIFSGDRTERGLVVERPIRTIDIAPTVCAWFGLSAPETFAGEDLTGALAGGSVPAVCDTAYVETFWTQLHYSWSPLQAVRTSRRKWIRAPRPELYDLNADPGETANRTGAEPPARQTLDGWLDRILSEADDQARRYGATVADVDPDLDRKLQALGYVSGKRNDALVADYTLPDPKDGNESWNRPERRLQHLQAARRFIEHGRGDRALRRLEMASDISPLSRQDAAIYAALLGQAGRLEESLAAYANALRTEPEAEGQAIIRLEMIKILATLGRREAARAHIDSMKTDPRTPPRFHAQLKQMESRLQEGR